MKGPKISIDILRPDILRLDAPIPFLPFPTHPAGKPIIRFKNPSVLVTLVPMLPLIPSQIMCELIQISFKTGRRLNVKVVGGLMVALAVTKTELFPNDPMEICVSRCPEN